MATLRAKDTAVSNSVLKQLKQSFTAAFAFGAGTLFGNLATTVADVTHILIGLL